MINTVTYKVTNRDLDPKKTNYVEHDGSGFIEFEQYIHYDAIKFYMELYRKEIIIVASSSSINRHSVLT